METQFVNLNFSDTLLDAKFSPLFRDFSLLPDEPN